MRLGTLFNDIFDRKKAIERTQDQLSQISDVLVTKNTPGWAVIEDCLRLEIRSAEQQILFLSADPIQNEKKLLALNELRGIASRWLANIEALVDEAPKLQAELEQLKRSPAPNRDQRAA